MSSFDSDSGGAYCGGCHDFDGCHTLYDVERLTLYRFEGGRVGWKVERSELCQACLDGAALLGRECINGQETFGTDRQPGARPERIRFAS